MANKMLIDAAHPEETRVVVLRGNRVQEFDFEAANRKQLRGNIYLAKVTRVEPSLQAAFVDYGGNRHGFLAFSEIHPDYYQIPVADRQALIDAEYGAIEDSDAGNDEPGSRSVKAEQAKADKKTSEGTGESPDGDAETADDLDDKARESIEKSSADDEPITGEAADQAASDGDGDDVLSDEEVDSVGAEDALEEVPERRKQRVRQYKIQEVIKRRQVLLVQVVKEERGNKGAALTTYLSLAGRYSVLMPNTARGGGISRKITNVTDRKRMKDVVAGLDVPEGMGVILRTAGASRTKAEVKRDFEYLLRLWENVRDLTLNSIAPALVYEEGSLIKRSIRDLYNKDIDEILVAGDQAFREAKDFMRMLMPSHAKNVKAYNDNQPLFARSGIESQLDAMFSPQVTLRSGGYLVINQTEALVSVDVNSGRSTREHNIEDTALQTNLEASDEVARQLRLRDLAGLIVIDFIDMEEKRNNRAVERRLKEALKTDRARIQVGRISHFGLLEMSRQRIRAGVLESTTSVCPTCQGAGHVRSPSSLALHVLRSLEDQLLKGATHNLVIRTPTTVALYILNQKRSHVSDLEQRFGLSIAVLADEDLSSGTHFVVDRGEPAERPATVQTSVQPDSVAPIEDDDDADADADAEDIAEADNDVEAAEEREARPRRRSRRRRGSGAGKADEKAEANNDETRADGGDDDGDAVEAAEGETRSDDENPPRKRRRGRRGGRRGRRNRGGDEQTTEAANGGDQPGGDTEQVAVADAGNNGTAPADDAARINGEAEPAATPDPVAGPADVPPAEPIALPVDQPEPSAATDEWQAEPPEEQAATPVEEAASPVEEAASPVEDTPPPAPQPSEPEGEAEPEQPKRGGWWQRRSFF